MRVLIVIALLVGATLMILFVLGDLARELSRDSFHAPPDLDSSDDWESEGDELSNAVPPFVDWTERRTVGRNSVGRMRGDDAAARSNALDDLHSAL